MSILKIIANKIKIFWFGDGGNWQCINKEYIDNKYVPISLFVNDFKRFNEMQTKEQKEDKNYYLPVFGIEKSTGYLKFDWYIFSDLNKK